MSAASLRRLEALSELSRRLIDNARERFLEDCVDVLVDFVHAGAAAVLLVRDEFDMAAQRGLLPESSRGGFELRARIVELAQRAASEHRIVEATDFSRLLGSADADDWFFSAYKSAVAVPIERDQQPLAVAVLVFDSHDAIDPELVVFARTVANLLSFALQNVQRPDEERRSIEDLDDANRMASLGLLTATVAHELRGPAGALVLQLEEQRRLMDQLEGLAGTADPAFADLAAELDEVTQDAELAVAKIRETVDQLSTLSRRDTEFEPLDIGEVTDAFLSVVRPHLERRGIQLHAQLTPGCLTSGRRDNLGQVVVNLVLNAADACEASSARPARVDVRVAEEGDRVVFQVEDTGPGVAADAIKTIFKPFYTTKQRGKGTGLGLKICSDVVAAHGGHIEVVNRDGSGASFRVLLPKLEGESGVHLVARPEPFSGPAAPALRRRILVIDDDQVFSRTVRRALKPHEVRTAASASEAEIALLDSGYTPDLVLCDVFLPGAHGDVLHARITKVRPELANRFVFITGGALGKAEADYVQNLGCRTLFKPLDLRQILQELAALDEATNDPTHGVRTLSTRAQRAGGIKGGPPGRD